MKEREKVNRDFLEKTNFLYEDLYQALSNYTGATITEPLQVKKLWNLLLAEVCITLLHIIDTILFYCPTINNLL